MSKFFLFYAEYVIYRLILSPTNVLEPLKLLTSHPGDWCLCQPFLCCCPWWVSSVGLSWEVIWRRKQEKGAGGRRAGAYFWLSHESAGWPWANLCWTSLSLGFLIWRGELEVTEDPLSARIPFFLKMRGFSTVAEPAEKPHWSLSLVSLLYCWLLCRQAAGWLLRLRVESESEWDLRQGVLSSRGV